MSNEVINVIKSRRSIRAYKTTPLTDEQINILTDAALASPSAMNAQPYRFIVIKNKAMLQELEQDVIDRFTEIGNSMILERIRSRNNKVFYNAPCVIVIPVDSNNNYSRIDAGIAVQSIALAAKSIGLDSVILGMPAVVFEGKKADEWKKRLGFPEGYVFGIAIAVGQADMESEPHKPDPSKVSIID